MKKNFILKTLILTLSISLFSPLASINAKAATTAQPDINAQAAITMDLETGEIIYCKDADSKRYPASTTKLLTGLLLAENKQKSDEIAFTESAKIQPEYSLNINFMHNSMKVGDTMSADDVMKGLLLFSGNDTAYMIADNVAGNSQKFADMMNAKAKEIGANNSHFVTANGLHDENHYTTAYDLSLITKAAFQNDWERETMELADASIQINGAKVLLENRNLGLGKNGNIAGKTGLTNAAGGCLAAVYEVNGRKLIGVVLKSRQVDNADMTKFNDMDSIMNYSYNTSKTVYKSSGEEVGTTDVQYKSFGFFGPTKTITVPLKLTQDVTYYANAINDAESQITYDKTDSSAWKLLFNKDVTLTYSTRNHNESVAGSVDISFGNILKDNIIIYIATLASIIIIITLIILIKNMASNSRRRKRSYSRRRRR
ncbi:D-alanyl-D-alanine carboxypeptidase family protein [Clostridium butyricum]|uniref:Serine-type D-Ala-D-Ala carboxypeptidase n=1 Tax=Clostridium butyricum E4 str. BoNT E BL5262 TaxID=632245 RepID=C4II01_CLOBU|nr:serine hydrolase [Clostridium butyricum]APF23661.1 D-alanyl-D-alanine carboxypeptidase family protein [Clostridium butyricum]EDT76509.1 D-alanyl-D-alanine carboxypeptidase family [Clostridium butyricum 5521]EEP54393.1 serine-type D-Ala-D-Ala carboxypeptidase [Clostridium butyricum E4 str. BoNT E BL5262]NFL32421.1 D-alanyl-D-alanine carboxypeptidase [Clostridium butyricum]NFS18660.1 D-alanyl-D-alanine carboxypeptidase [Clostridium butyricum]